MDEKKNDNAIYMQSSYQMLRFIDRKSPREHNHVWQKLRQQYKFPL